MELPASSTEEVEAVPVRTVERLLPEEPGPKRKGLLAVVPLMSLHPDTWVAANDR